MATFTYSADNAFLTLNGFPINGLQEGSEISITMDEDVVSKQVDIDGKNVTFNKLNNNTATITFILNDGADANVTLFAQYQALKNNLPGGVLPIFFKDGDTGSTFISGSCTIMTLPSIVKGRESSGREWVLTTGQAEMAIGSANTAY
jgi:hypothetical protein